LKIKLIAIISLLLLCWLGGSCALSRDFDNHLNSIVKPHGFSIMNWTFKTMLDEANQWIFNRHEKTDDEISGVTEYFSSIERIKAWSLC